MVANRIFWQRDSGACKRIFATRNMKQLRQNIALKLRHLRNIFLLNNCEKKTKISNLEANFGFKMLLLYRIVSHPHTLRRNNEQQIITLEIKDQKSYFFQRVLNDSKDCTVTKRSEKKKHHNYRNMNVIQQKFKCKDSLSIYFVFC